MRNHTKALIISTFAFFLASCASVEVKDNDPVDPQQGYAVIKLDFEFGDNISAELDIELSRVDKTGVQEKIFLPKFANHSPTILRLPPGYYYLSFLGHGHGYWKERLGASATLFEVRPGVLSYAGDWHRKSAATTTQVSGDLGSGFSSSGIYYQGGWVEDNPATFRAIKARYPGITAKMEMVFTGQVPTVKPTDAKAPIRRPALESIPQP